MKKTIFNVYTGETYQLNESEMKNILEGDIPLKTSPKSSCNKCYGRGYTSFDITKKSYAICPKCIDKQLDDRYLRAIKYTCLMPSKYNKSQNPLKKPTE